MLEHSLVKAVFGRKKTVQSKSVPQMAVFGNKRVIVTPKKHILGRND